MFPWYELVHWCSNVGFKWSEGNILRLPAAAPEFSPWRASLLDSMREQLVDKFGSLMDVRRQLASDTERTVRAVQWKFQEVVQDRAGQRYRGARLKEISWTLWKFVVTGFKLALLLAPLALKAKSIVSDIFWCFHDIASPLWGLGSLGRSCVWLTRRGQLYEVRRFSWTAPCWVLCLSSWTVEESFVKSLDSVGVMAKRPKTLFKARAEPCQIHAGRSDFLAFHGECWKLTMSGLDSAHSLALVPALKYRLD